MGCFDETCCVSGLPIKREQPVRFGIVSLNERTSRRGHSGESYQFWTPLFKSTYNDYGSIEWDEIEPKPLWDWIWGTIIPHIKPLQNYPHYATKSDKPEDIFSDLISHRREIFPDNWQTGTIRKLDPAKANIWMCHEWAFQEVLKLNKSEHNYVGNDPENSIEQQANNYVNHGYISPEQDSTFRDSSGKIIDDKKFHEVFRETHNAPKHWIEGEQGFMHLDFRFTLNRHRDLSFCEVIGNQREAFVKSLIETGNFVSNLFLLRKGIIPNLFFGMQHDWCEYLADWTKLVATKARQQKRKLND